MNLQTLVTTLTSAGVRLSIEGDQLKVDAPRGALTEADRAAISQHRQELIALLSAPVSAPPLKREIGVRSLTGLMPAECLFEGCAGQLHRFGVDLWQCSARGHRFRLKQPEPWDFIVESEAIQ